MVEFEALCVGGPFDGQRRKWHDTLMQLPLPPPPMTEGGPGSPLESFTYRYVRGIRGDLNFWVPSEPWRDLIWVQQQLIKTYEEKHHAS